MKAMNEQTASLFAMNVNYFIITKNNIILPTHTMLQNTTYLY